MRCIVIGAGAVGSLVGAALHEATVETVLVGRGPHAAAVRRQGLVVEDHDGSRVLSVAIALEGERLEPRDDDVVLLAVKSQHTTAVLAQVLETHSPATPVFCLQNGVANERSALRLFRHVYGVCVNAPIALPSPGTVRALAGPTNGLLDVGVYPHGVDALAQEIVAAFAGSGFEAVPSHDVMAHKHSKLLLNLANAARAVCREGDARADEVVDRAFAEGRLSLSTAGIAYVDTDTTIARRRSQLRQLPWAMEEPDDEWQTQIRRSWAAESDWFNGEIALLGRLHGVPTPVNDALQREARKVAAGGAPHQCSPQQLLGE